MGISYLFAHIAIYDFPLFRLIPAWGIRDRIRLLHVLKLWPGTLVVYSFRRGGKNSPMAFLRVKMAFPILLEITRVRYNLRAGTHLWHFLGLREYHILPPRAQTRDIYI